MTITRCDFISNAAGDDGGGVRINDDFVGQDDVDFDECFFRENEADAGGAVYVTDGSGTTTFTDCEFEENSASSTSSGDAGGAVYVNGGEAVVFTKCRFELNTARDGGGVYVAGRDATFTLCNFSANQANLPGTSAGDGGGVWASSFAGINENPGRIVFNNTLFGRNVAKDNGGGVHFTGGADIDPEYYPLFASCTFAKNEAGDDGGGVFYDDSGTGDGIDPEVVNCVLWDNTDNGGSNNDESSQIHRAATGAAVFNYNCITDYSGGGTGNIDDDPEFFDPTGSDPYPINDFSLDKTVPSPCIDEGDNDEVTVSVDLVGADRIIDSNVDIGGFETCTACTCDDGDPCTYCDELDCAGGSRVYGDLGGFGGYCAPDGNVNALDMASVLNTIQFGTCPVCHVDIAGTSPACEPDGFANATDTGAILNVIQQISSCSCSPLAIPPPGGEQTQRTAFAANFAGSTPALYAPGASAYLTLVPRSPEQGSDVVPVDLYAHNVSGLRLYEAVLEITGATINDLVIDEQRDDFIFAGRRCIATTVPESGRLLAVAESGEVSTGDQGAYLATLYISPTAAEADVSIVADGYTFLADTNADPIPIQPPTSQSVSHP